MGITPKTTQQNRYLQPCINIITYYPIISQTRASKRAKWNGQHGGVVVDRPLSL